MGNRLATAELKIPRKNTVKKGQPESIFSPEQSGTNGGKNLGRKKLGTKKSGQAGRFPKIEERSVSESRPRRVPRASCVIGRIRFRAIPAILLLLNDHFAFSVSPCLRGRCFAVP